MLTRRVTTTVPVLAAAAAMVVAGGGEAAARPGCHGVFPFNRTYERVVDLKGGRVGISCSKALKVADKIVASYGDIPISSYPSDPRAAAGVEGGQD